MGGEDEDPDAAEVIVAAEDTDDALDRGCDDDEPAAGTDEVELTEDTVAEGLLKTEDNEKPRLLDRR